MPTTTTMPETKLQVVGLDGQTRDWSDVFASEPRHRHGITNTVEYVVRRTFFWSEHQFDCRPHQDVASFPADGDGYTDALIAARWLRAHTTGGYAVIDAVYSCGCRNSG